MAESRFEPRAHTVLWQFIIPQCMGLPVLVEFFKHAGAWPPVQGF